MPVIASGVPVNAMGRIGSAMEPGGIAVGVTPTAVTSGPARGKVTARGKMSTAVEVTAAGGRMPASTKMTATARVATAAAMRLRQHGCRAYQQRPQNAGCQNKAPALGTHDCHLPLQAPPGAAILKPIL